MYIPLPKGYVVGDRIRTNATYALVNPRIKEPRYGVITNGSHSTPGPVMVRLDGQKDARAMTPNLFDVIKWSGSASACCGGIFSKQRARRDVLERDSGWRR
jgi:hypothetical protein